MSEFFYYLEQGINHILDLEGMDHMLFVAMLCARYEPKQWKKLLILLTSFTIGHSITLLFTSLGYRFLSSELVEVLIPITILLTGISNLFAKDTKQQFLYSYAIALGFGLIHGMGFSNFFTAMMMGIEDNIVMPLLAFNIGIEIGQLIIVAVFLGLYFAYQKLSKQPHKYWRIGLSSLGSLVAAWWIVA